MAISSTATVPFHFGFTNVISIPTRKQLSFSIFSFCSSSSSSSSSTIHHSQQSEKPVISLLCHAEGLIQFILHFSTLTEFEFPFVGFRNGQSSLALSETWSLSRWNTNWKSRRYHSEVRNICIFLFFNFLFIVFCFSRFVGLSAC